MERKTLIIILSAALAIIIAVLIYYFFILKKPVAQVSGIETFILSPANPSQSTSITIPTGTQLTFGIYLSNAKPNSTYTVQLAGNTYQINTDGNGNGGIALATSPISSNTTVVLTITGPCIPSAYTLNISVTTSSITTTIPPPTTTSSTTTTILPPPPTTTTTIPPPTSSTTVTPTSTIVSGGSQYNGLLIGFETLFSSTSSTPSQQGNIPFSVLILPTHPSGGAVWAYVFTPQQVSNPSLLQLCISGAGVNTCSGNTGGASYVGTYNGYYVYEFWYPQQMYLNQSFSVYLGMCPASNPSCYAGAGLTPVSETITVPGGVPDYVANGYQLAIPSNNWLQYLQQFGVSISNYQVIAPEFLFGTEASPQYFLLNYLCSPVNNSYYGGSGDPSTIQQLVTSGKLFFGQIFTTPALISSCSGYSGGCFGLLYGMAFPGDTAGINNSQIPLPSNWQLQGGLYPDVEVNIVIKNGQLCAQPTTFNGYDAPALIEALGASNPLPLPASGVPLGQVNFVSWYKNYIVDYNSNLPTINVNGVPLQFYSMSNSIFTEPVSGKGLPGVGQQYSVVIGPANGQYGPYLRPTITFTLYQFNTVQDYINWVVNAINNGQYVLHVYSTPITVSGMTLSSYYIEITAPPP